MAKEKERDKERKMLVGVVWNFVSAADLKFLITILLFLCSLATVLQFLPSRFYFSPTNLSDFKLVPTSTSTSTSPQQGGGVIIKRSFNPYAATAAYNFILMSAYRGGLNTFAVTGLSSKPLHVFGNPSYQCQWIPHNSTTATATIPGHKILPDWGYGRVYTTLVVNCTFPFPVGMKSSGGKLLLHASTNGGGDRSSNLTDTIEALTELPGSLNHTLFTSRPKYDYLYCGSPLYGNLSSRRVNEWLAYHMRLFGERSHFVLYDAGGVQVAMMRVLKPWIEMGYVSLHDVREQERFDGYYHNQFLILNDCLHRYRFDAKWMFFFDVDEYLFVPPESTIESVTDSLSEFTQFTIQQRTMSSKLCLSEDKGKTFRKWGFEKLVYRDVKKGIRRDRKYAVQPRNVFATGVHRSQNIAGKTNHKTWSRINYFHYHGTIAQRTELCQHYLFNAPNITIDGIPYVLDNTMRGVAPAVKRFELKMIGPNTTTTTTS